MNYTHPKSYKGLQVSTPNKQLILKAYVEANCLKCDNFCGQEHDFSECKLALLKYNNITCPVECRTPVSLVDPGSCVKLKSLEQ